MLNRLSRRSRPAPRHARGPAVRFRRLVVGAPGLALITLVTLAALAGCSGSDSSSSAESSTVSAPRGPAAGLASPPGAAAAAGSAAPGVGTGQSVDSTALAASGQQLIYTASLVVRARSVSAAVARATAIVDSAGGYVSTENATSDPDHPDQATATVGLKIPVAAYSAALRDLTLPSLGTQISLRQQTQDVTEQVANVSSRVASDGAAIAQLRALLKHAGTVGGLLSVQDQINAQESDLEAMLAQQSALNHETSYATVTLTVIGPKAAARPARHAHTPGLVNGLVNGWHAFRTSLSWLLAILGAVAPFAVVIALIVTLAFLARRGHARRRRQAGSPAAGSPAES